jgi:hypothetical protein
MPQYRVAVYGGMDGLLFEDLVVLYSSGVKFALRVKQGDMVPIEIFDPLDIKKSLAVGSLGSYVRSGAVRVEFSDLEKNNKKRKPRPVEVPVVQQTQPSVEVAQPIQQQPEETPKVQDAPADLKDVKAVDDFFKLSFFNRLKFIQNCTDKGVLSELLSKIDSPQLKNNIQYRLENL